jgi:hypothetical protein
MTSRLGTLTPLSRKGDAKEAVTPNGAKRTCRREQPRVGTGTGGISQLREVQAFAPKVFRNDPGPALPKREPDLGERHW